MAAAQAQNPPQDVSELIAVRHEYDIPYARMAAANVARRLGFSDRRRNYLVTAVSELAANLCFHTLDGGTIEVCCVHRDGRLGIEVLAIDHGPGIPDIAKAMQDGYSTNGGLGGGLPGAARLMDEFEISSQVGQGTRVAARIWST